VPEYLRQQLKNQDSIDEKSYQYFLIKYDFIPEETEIECPICLETFTFESKIFVLKCGGHLFYHFVKG
jgi:hypothetical protein